MYTTFYYSCSKFSDFIQGKFLLLQQLASVSLLKEKSKICPKLIELLSWNGANVHVCCFMLARASTKTFVSRVQKTAEKIFVSRKIRQRSLVSRGITVLYDVLTAVSADDTDRFTLGFPNCYKLRPSVFADRIEFSEGRKIKILKLQFQVR